MGLSSSSSRKSAHSRQAAADPKLPSGVGPSIYQRRLEQLAKEVLESPPAVSLEKTLRNCIDFCYGGGPDWAPHVRVTVYADNPSEHQTNVPVYSTLLCTWGEPAFVNERIDCRAIPGTDVSGGCNRPSPFWNRRFQSDALRRPVLYRDLGHQLLHWFSSLDNGDPRKQLLVNIMLQLHEACYNCIGRHKEVFEYSIYDLIDSELETASSPLSSVGNSEIARAGAQGVVMRHAGVFLDRHKRHALQASILSPLKFLYQNTYEVFENIDSHGASFWSCVLASGFFPELELPYESIVDLDNGWTWGAIDFLELMRTADGEKVLERFLAPQNIGRDWRTLSRGIPAPRTCSRKRLPGLPMTFSSGFQAAVEAARNPRSELHKAIRPYAERFRRVMDRDLMLRNFAMTALSSAAWDASLGPALSCLSESVFGTTLAPADLRAVLLGDCTDAANIQVDIENFSSLLRSAGVLWA